VTDGTRRTGQVRVRGRAEQVVERVVAATAHELGRVGYAALRIDDVAVRAGVNKTTIYRRWPTKAELVTATLQGRLRGRPAIDTGSVRGDLRASLLAVVDLSPADQGLLRVVQLERTDPHVDALARRLRAEIHRARVAMVERGIARGELPRGVDADLVVDMISAPVQRALLFNEPVTARQIDRVLDLALAGAAACADKKRTKRTRSRR
jgi:AcrR family transcriptional regulator